MSIRKPLVSGQFYSSNRKALEKEITDSFKSKFGPGALPDARSGKKISGIISPHAGYFFSGAGNARVFKELAESRFPETYILLGVNHAARITCTSNEAWETPLGTVSCDEILVKKLEEKGIQINNLAHQQEHSIEVQLPFLQYASRDRIKDLRIVPIMIADDSFDKWGKIISGAVQECGREVVIICSSDFTHYGRNYGYVPFNDDVEEMMKKLDNAAMEKIISKDAVGFIGYTKRTGATICGRCGIAVFIQLMKNMFADSKGEILNYYTSGDVVGDYRTAVGYASIVFN